MGACASKPKALDGQAPEDKLTYTSAPSDVTSAPAEATAAEAAAESKISTPREHEQEEHSETAAAPMEGETKKDGSSTGDDSGTHQEQEQR